ncbi:hypothetical protein PSR1_03259 [Anaeromyxobacter sp. PSR-1]|nr:hypothetical protein PSR1_03259 [Anaeromyxobacter sp. PSR-1]
MSSVRAQIRAASGNVIPMSVVGTIITRKLSAKRPASSASHRSSRPSIHRCASPISAPMSGRVASVEAAMPAWTQPNARRGLRTRSTNARATKLPSAMPTRKAVSMVTNA